MWNLIAFAAGIGFGLMGIAAYVKTNLEARKDARNYLNRILELEETVRKGQRIDPRVLIEKEKDLIESAKDEIRILGINALGVFHESFENIIKFIRRNGKIMVLLLDPQSDAFKQRENQEEGIETKRSGRLRAEYETSVAFCKDIVRFGNNSEALELRVFNEEPKVALLVADASSDEGLLHLNEYSTRTVRGYAGEHRYVVKNLNSETFYQLLQKYDDLWDNAKKVRF